MTAPSAPRNANSLPSRARRTVRAGAAVGLLALAATALAPSVAQAGSIGLQSSFAGPIASSTPLCTAEPRGYVYGTQNFNPAQPIDHRSEGEPSGYYIPANAPSFLDLVPNLLAGERSDLCIGFTLPPNVEPKLVSVNGDAAPRLQDTPPWPDLPDTHVSSFPAGSMPVHGDDLRRLALTLPAGYSADFASTPRCSDDDFGAGTFRVATCPAATRIGDALVRVSAYAASTAGHEVLTGLALSNLTPHAGELGRLGVSFKAAPSLAPAKWELGVRFATDGSGRLVAEATDAARLTYDTTAIAKAGDAWGGNGADLLGPADPRIGQPQPGADSRPLYVEGLSLRIWGAKSAHPSLAADFGAQAGRCGTPLAAGLSASSFGGHSSAATTEPFALVDCSSLPLPATASGQLTAPSAGAATGAVLAVDLPQTGARLPAQPTGLSLALPAGVELGPQLASGADGQPTCSVEQFAAGSGAASSCPAATKIGTATVRGHAAAQAFTGHVYLGRAPSEAALAAIHVEVAQPGSPATAARLKFSGTLELAAGGQLVMSFAAFPSLRIAGLELALRGGEQAMLTAPRSCGSHTGIATLERQGAAPTTASLDLPVSAGCEAAPAPGLSAAPVTPRSGGRAGTSVSLTRAANAPDVDAFAVTLPPGTVISPSAVPACSGAEQASGDCPAASQIGTLTLTAGAGAQPLSINGGIFLAPTPSGAFAGAVLVAAVRLGDLDLGRLVAPASFSVDPGSRTLTLRATLPSRVAGVALDLRRVTLDFDRDGVVRQPTACGPLPVSAVLSAGGADSTPATTVDYPSCSGLEFAPGFAASTSGDTKAGGHPKVSLALTPRSSDAGLRAIRLTLPPTLALDAAAKPCELAAFDAGACPAATKVGVAGGKVSVASDFLGGDAFLVRIPGASAPGIAVRFSGSFAHRVVGRFGSGERGSTTLTFDDLPDLPLSRWALQLDGGKSGALRAVAAPAGCTAQSGWVAELAAQNGAQVRRGASAPCAAAASQSPVVALSVSAKTGIKLKLTQFGGKQLQAVKLSMPKTIRVNAPKAKRRGRTSIALIGAKATPAFTSGSLILTTYGGTPTEVVARLRTTAYTVGGKAPAKMAGKLKGKKRTVAFKLRLAYRDGTVAERAVSVRLP